MKKWIIFLLCFVPVFLGGCQGLKTPEELIGPPEVNVEKKYLKDTILEFIPDNSELLNLPQGRGANDIDSVMGVNLRDSSEGEIVAVYRGKTDRKIGILILSKEEHIWKRAFELRLDALELSDYLLVDLDGDETKEILLGYFRSSDSVKELLIIGSDQKEIKKLFETQYLALDISRVSEDHYVDLAISSGGSNNNNKFQIVNYKSGMIQIVGELIYPENNEIYKISYANINVGQKAYFLDMYVDNSTGRTDIVALKDQALISLVRKNDVKELTQEVPTESRDINGDGIVEAIQNRIVEKKDDMPILIRNSSYNINLNEELILGMESYESFEDNIRISLPPIAYDAIAVKKSPNGVICSYISQSLGIRIPFLEVRAVDNLEIEDYGFEYTQVDERYGRTILAKLVDTEMLEGAEQNEFDKIFRSLQNFPDHISFIE